jgi:hypothetical protein
MHTAYKSYIDTGFALVPIVQGSKGPKHSNWNREENCIRDSSQIPENVGVGIAHAYSGTCAIDIDDWSMASTTLGFVGINLQGLFDAPDSVSINSGNPGHAKLLYRMPFGLVLPSKKCIHTDQQGIKRNWIDFRCATADGLTVQDVLPSALIHPTTGRPYQWSGNGHYTNLPLLPPELMAYWRAIIDAETKRTINVQGSSVSASWDEIKQALCFISPDCDRDHWITTLMALHHAGTVTNKLDEALALADEWSSQSATKYKGQKDILNSWRGFKPDGGVTLGSLFKFAHDGGWVRPLPDITSLFGAIPVEETVSPKSLIDALHVPPPELNLDLLPKVLAARAIEVGQSIGCDPLVAAWAGLGAAAGVVDARTRLELMHEFSVPPILWLCTIGHPADKKTPAARPMLGVLKSLEKEDAPHYKTRKLLYEIQAAQYEKAKKELMTSALDTHAQLEQGHSGLSQQGDIDLSIMPSEPIVPHPLRIVVSDITSQKLVRMCAERPQGLLCHLDEMNSWIKKLCNQSSSQESRSHWVQSYECDPATLDRVGTGNNASENNVLADNFAVSIYGNMQPAVLKANWKLMAEDGLIQRFLPAILRDRYSTKKGNPIPKELTSHSLYEQAIRRIHAQGETRYKMSPEAHQAFRNFQDWYHELKSSEKLLNADHAYMTALGKIEGTCGRIILFWHLFDDPNSTHVSLDTAERAIEFVKTYLVNALRYAFGEVGGVHTDSIDHYVTEYVLQHSGETEMVSLSDLRRSMRRRLEGMTTSAQEYAVKDAMDVLEKAGWVKIARQDNKSTQWFIDPRLADHYKEHRQAVIAAKQLRYDLIHAKSEGRAPRYIVKGFVEGENDDE